MLTNLQVTAFYFAAALVLLERGQGVLAYPLGVSKMRGFLREIAMEKGRGEAGAAAAGTSTGCTVCRPKRNRGVPTSAHRPDPRGPFGAVMRAVRLRLPDRCHHPHRTLSERTKRPATNAFRTKQQRLDVAR